MYTAYISLGSNIGNREAYLEKAIQILGSHGKIEVKRLSSIYETEPVGYTDQGEFLNMVIAVQTSLRPETLLHQCLQVEIDLGREREFKWGPRIIDLDVLLYEQETIETTDLLIPTRGCKKELLSSYRCWRSLPAWNIPHSVPRWRIFWTKYLTKKEFGYGNR